MALSFSVGNLPSMKGNVTLFSSRGVAFMSGFGYSTLIKSIQSELKRNTKIYNSKYTLDAKAKSLALETAKIPNSDFSNIIIYAKDFTERKDESSDNETINFNIFVEMESKYENSWSNIDTSLDAYYTWEIDEFLTDVYKAVEPELKQKVLDVAFNKFYNLCPVPIKKEWTDFLLKKLRNRYCVKAFSGMDIRKDKRMFGWNISAKVNTIIEILSTGIKEDEISVCATKEVSNTIKEITGLDSYLNSYKEVLAEKIKDNFVPMFNPEIDTYSKELTEVADYVDYIGNINLYDAQRGVIETVSRTLKKQKSVFIVASMGSGKTLMAMSTCYLHNLTENNNQQMTNVIMCPGHLVEKWKREVEMRLPQSKSVIVNNFNDLLDIQSDITNTKRGYHLWIVMSKEAAKYGYEERPAVIWKNQKDKSTGITGYYASPTTGKPIYRYEYHGTGRRRYQLKLNLTELDFLKPNKDNYIIDETIKVFDNETKRWEDKIIRTKLWTPVNSALDDNAKWIKVGKHGYVEVNKIRKLYNEISGKDVNGRNKLEKTLLPEFDKILNGEVPIQRAPRKYPIAKYINKFLKGHIDYFIADEIQELKGKDSLQGQAFGILLATAKKSLCLTGTLLNGYASSLYYTLFRAFPQLMKKEGFEYSTESKKEFIRMYGVYKTISSWVIGDNNQKKSGLIMKEMPGISPLIFTKFLLENVVFMTQEDMSEAMPGYEEIPIGIDMDEPLANVYNAMQDNIKTELSRSSTGKMKVMSQITQLMSVYPDQPYGQKQIINPDNGKIIYTPEELTKFTNKKAEELLRICKEKKEAGEKVLVYYHWTNRTDIGTDLPRYLEENGIKAITMTSSVKSSTREEWLDKKLKAGYDVVLGNPSLVETGLDLLAFTTIVFYQMGYNLFTMRQASRRSWRLSQDKDVQVYFLYYKGTIQETILSLMASKLQASMAIEGKFTEEGLNAMSNNDDILNQIAMSITDGIKDTVDVATFTKVTSESQKKTAKEQQEKLINIPRLFKYETLQEIVKGKRRTKTNSINVYDALELAIG